MGAGEENPRDKNEFGRTEKYIQEQRDLELDRSGAT